MHGGPTKCWWLGDATFGHGTFFERKFLRSLNRSNSEALFNYAQSSCEANSRRFGTLYSTPVDDALERFLFCPPQLSSPYEYGLAPNAYRGPLECYCVKGEQLWRLPFPLKAIPAEEISFCGPDVKVPGTDKLFPSHFGRHAVQEVQAALAGERDFVEVRPPDGSTTHRLWTPNSDQDCSLRFNKDVSCGTIIGHPYGGALRQRGGAGTSSANNVQASTGSGGGDGAAERTRGEGNATAECYSAINCWMLDTRIMRNEMFAASAALSDPNCVQVVVRVFGIPYAVVVAGLGCMANQRVHLSFGRLPLDPRIFRPYDIHLASIGDVLTDQVDSAGSCSLMTPTQPCSFVDETYLALRDATDESFHILEPFAIAIEVVAERASELEEAESQKNDPVQILRSLAFETAEPDHHDDVVAQSSDDHIMDGPSLSSLRVAHWAQAFANLARLPTLAKFLPFGFGIGMWRLLQDILNCERCLKRGEHLSQFDLFCARVAFQDLTSALGKHHGAGRCTVDRPFIHAFLMQVAKILGGDNVDVSASTRRGISGSWWLPSEAPENDNVYLLAEHQRHLRTCAMVVMNEVACLQLNAEPDPSLVHHTAPVPSAASAMAEEVSTTEEVEAAAATAESAPVDSSAVSSIPVPPGKRHETTTLIMSQIWGDKDSTSSPSQQVKDSRDAAPPSSSQSPPPTSPPPMQPSRQPPSLPPPPPPTFPPPISASSGAGASPPIARTPTSTPQLPAAPVSATFMIAASIQAAASHRAPTPPPQYKQKKDSAPHPPANERSFPTHSDDVGSDYYADEDVVDDTNSDDGGVDPDTGWSITAEPWFESPAPAAPAKTPSKPPRARIDFEKRRIERRAGLPIFELLVHERDQVADELSGGDRDRSRLPWLKDTLDSLPGLYSIGKKFFLARIDRSEHVLMCLESVEDSIEYPEFFGIEILGEPSIMEGPFSSMDAVLCGMKNMKTLDDSIDTTSFAEILQSKKKRDKGDVAVGRRDVISLTPPVPIDFSNGYTVVVWVKLPGVSPFDYRCLLGGDIAEAHVAIYRKCWAILPLEKDMPELIRNSRGGNCRIPHGRSTWTLLTLAGDQTSERFYEDGEYVGEGPPCLCPIQYLGNINTRLVPISCPFASLKVYEGMWTEEQVRENFEKITKGTKFEQRRRERKTSSGPPPQMMMSGASQSSSSQRKTQQRRNGGGPKNSPPTFESMVPPPPPTHSLKALHRHEPTTGSEQTTTNADAGELEEGEVTSERAVELVVADDSCFMDAVDEWEDWGQLPASNIHMDDGGGSSEEFDKTVIVESSSLRRRQSSSSQLQD